MDSLSLEAIIQKYEVLPKSAKREVADFIDFLVQKKKGVKKTVDKAKLRQISCWTDADIEAIEDAGAALNKWTPKVF